MSNFNERELTDSELAQVTGAGSSDSSSETQSFNIGDLQSLAINIANGTLTETLTFAPSAGSPFTPGAGVASNPPISIGS